MMVIISTRGMTVRRRVRETKARRSHRPTRP